MPNTRTLADIWKSLSVEERLCVVIERYHSEMPKVPSTLQMSGYQMCIDDIQHYVLDMRPLPPEDWQ